MSEKIRPINEPGYLRKNFLRQLANQWLLRIAQGPAAR